MNKNDETEFKSLQHRIMVSDNVYFENKDNYFSLMKAFINKNIDGTNFETEFLEIYNLDQDVSEILEKDFSKLPNLKAKGFSGFLSRVFTACDVFESRSEIREEYELDEEQFRDFVKKIFFQMQKYLDE